MRMRMMMMMRMGIAREMLSGREGKEGSGEREMDAEPLWLFVWATAVSAVPSRTRISLMAKR